MKTLLAFLVSLFTSQALLFGSAATDARRLLTLESWRQSNCGSTREGLGRRPRRAPPPPPGYSPGPIPKMKSPRRPSPYVIRGSAYPRRAPTPPPHISPGPVPRRRSPPRPFTVVGSLPATAEHPSSLQGLVYDESPPNPYAASA